MAKTTSKKKDPTIENENAPDESGELSIADQQAEHPTLKWFDEFHVRIQKRSVKNVLAGRDETIITGWEVVKKLMPKFIEPGLAAYTNSFANGYDVNNVGLYLALKGTLTVGQIIPYKEWADERKIDPKQDINQLLA